MTLPTLTEEVITLLNISRDGQLTTLQSIPFRSCMVRCLRELCPSKVAAKEQPSPPGDGGRVGGREGVGI